MINHASQSLDQEMPRRLTDAERALRGIKTKQNLGGDVVVVSRANFSITTTIAAGGTFTPGLNFFGTLKVDYVSELMMAFYINNDLNNNFAWPWGLSVLPTDLTVQPLDSDWAFSDTTGVGNKSYFRVIKNNTASPITLYIHGAILFTKQVLSS